MKGLGTDDSILINILGNRSKDHLQQVQRMYEAQYKKTLEHDIRGDTSFNYRKLLTYLLLPPLQLKINYLRDSMKGKPLQKIDSDLVLASEFTQIAKLIPS